MIVDLVLNFSLKHINTKVQVNITHFIRSFHKHKKRYISFQSKIKQKQKEKLERVKKKNLRSLP